MNKIFLPLAKTALVLVYLVIIAGALVRMTGSGMGCPDWPKCFGYYIPPTDIKELTWEPDRTFRDGQVIIKDQALWVAQGNFTTGKTYNAENWRLYTKHNYAIFNPAHTWIEYLNRLVGALAGLFVLAMAVTSFWTKKRAVILLSWLSVFLMGFQAWLGATVVYSVLNPVKITVHMVVALIIVGFILYAISKASAKNTRTVYDPVFRRVLILALFLTLIQIALGTQVRQFVDDMMKQLGGENMVGVLENPSVTFYIHRSFSVVIFAITAFLFYRNRKHNLDYGKMNWVMCIVLMEIASGIAMYYFDFPLGSQPFHVVAASVLFGLQFYMLMENSKATAQN